MEKTYVFGHHNPDTDTVCGAISLSYLKNKLGMNTEPRVLDAISKETEFVLNHFKVNAPKYLDNVKVQIKDIVYHKDYCMKGTVSIKKVYDFLIDKEITGLPIVNDDGTYLGLITSKMILKKLLGVALTHVTTSYDNVLEVLEGKEILRFNDEIDGEIIANEIDSDFEKEVVESGKNSVFVISNKDLIESTIKNKAKNIIVIGSFDIDKKLLEEAKKNKINIIRTELEVFKALKFISLTNYASVFCAKETVVVNENGYYDDFVDLSRKLRHNNYPVVDDDNKCLGLLRLTDLENVNRKHVILVDHNESAQSITGLSQAEILEIVDHHKIGDLTTSLPINFRNMAVGSSNTIIHQLYKENNVKIPSDIAGLMLSGILSDTLILKSPTTTELDVEVVNDLSKLAGVDYEKYGFDMFKAGTSLEGKTKQEVINTDIKTFTYGDDVKYAVSQIFTLDFDSIKKDMEGYISLIEDMAKENGFKFIVVVITDIIRNGSYFIFTKSGKEVLESGYGLKDIEQGVYIDDQVSRKKQVVPTLITGLNRLK
ncbi:MAG: putative manganese-dependent inorganic diphosphatase [Bacilli bacterium]|nr:putative manganese-dependent inorganic diphosphatase [Bacilli bacterium]